MIILFNILRVIETNKKYSIYINNERCIEGLKQIPPSYRKHYVNKMSIIKDTIQFDLSENRVSNIHDIDTNLSITQLAEILDDKVLVVLSKKQILNPNQIIIKIYTSDYSDIEIYSKDLSLDIIQET